MVNPQAYSPPMRQQPPRQCRNTRPGWPSNGSDYESSVGSLAAAPSRSPSPAPSSQNSFSTTSSEASVLAHFFPKYPKDPIVAEPSWEIPPTGHFNRVNPRYAHMLTSLGLPQGYEDLPRPTGSETSTEVIGGGSVYGSSRCSTVHRAHSIISEQDVNNQIEEDRRRAMNARLFATARAPRSAAGASTEYAYFGKMMAQQHKNRSLWHKAGLQIERITTFFEIIAAEFSFKKVSAQWIFSRVEFLLLVIVGVMIAQFLLSYFK